DSRRTENGSAPHLDSVDRLQPVAVGVHVDAPGQRRPSARVALALRERHQERERFLPIEPGNDRRSLRRAGESTGAVAPVHEAIARTEIVADRKSTRLNSSHVKISYAVFCLKKKNN